MTAIDMNFSLILPEIALALFAMAALMLGAFFGKDRLAGTVLWLSVTALLLAALFVGWGDRVDGQSFWGMFIDDAFARFAKVTALAAAAAVLAMSAGYLDRQGLLRFELPILIVLAVVGMMVMVSAGDLLTLYMGLELQSLALYVVAAMRRDSVRSSEVGLKYFVLGSLSSGMLLYGISLVYGFAGTTNLAGVMQAVTAEQLPMGLLFGMVFLLVGLAFKVSAVPFHMWTPDVYEGSPTPITAFFATAPKVAAMALIARLMWGAFGQVPGDWGQIIAVLALLSMFLGSIAGIGQRDIKRLMAYSSIAHMGFALIGLAAGTVYGVQAMLMYMAIYVVMNVGTFAFILSMERGGRPVTALDDLNLLARTEPLRALAMLVLAWFSGSALGLVFLSIRTWFPVPGQMISQVFGRANMVASGKMFAANNLPNFMLAMFDWNPLFHIIDQTRGFAFINYSPRNSSLSYPLYCIVALLMIGLMAEYVSRKSVSISTLAGR